MRVVVALGGNALLARGERPDHDVQERHVQDAVTALVPLLDDHQLIVTHGNGPQVGLLAIESADDRSLSRPYPLDALGAETQGLIGSWLVRHLRNRAGDREVVAVVTQTLVDPHDPAFADPTKFVGPVYDRTAADRLEAERGWVMARDGERWRRVVGSPAPLGVVEIETIRRLVDIGAIVVCAGGGGVPVARGDDGHLVGLDAVIDKDLTSALLAEQLDADALLLLTDVDGIQPGFGGPGAASISEITVADLRDARLPPGSMGPKAEAACRFVERTHGIAAIGSLHHAAAVLSGERGTRVHPTGIA